MPVISAKGKGTIENGLSAKPAENAMAEEHSNITSEVGKQVTIDRDKVTEALRLYPSYRYAVRMYELPRLIGASTADYSGMPKGGGFGSRLPSTNDGIGFQDTLDYNLYKQAVYLIEGALDALTDDEKAIVELKWMKGVTLSLIEQRRHMGIGYAKQVHRKALTKLAHALRFMELPKIEDLTTAKFKKKERFNLKEIG